MNSEDHAKNYLQVPSIKKKTDDNLNRRTANSP